MYELLYNIKYSSTAPNLNASRGFIKISTHNGNIQEIHFQCIKGTRSPHITPMRGHAHVHSHSMKTAICMNTLYLQCYLTRSS